MNQQQANPEASEVRRTTLAWVGRIAGPALAWLVYQLLPNSLDSAVLVPHAARATAAIGVWMAVWWMTEALPLPVTSLLPIVLFPLVGVFSSQARPGDIVIDEATSQFGRVVSLRDEIAAVEFADDQGRLATRTLPLKQLARHPRQTAITQAAAPYANPYIFLFMGGFMIALAVERWNLHRRVALLTVSAVGTQPRRLVAGFMIASAGLSMWISNTATTVMMLPIGLSLIALLRERMGSEDSRETDTSPQQSERSDGLGKNFATCLMLGIAYGASIGGVGTLIGTPPNTVLASFLSEQGIEIGFGQWMALGVPLVVVFLLIAWLLLTRVIFPIRVKDLPGGRKLIQEELAKLGPLSRGEKTVLVVFALTALAWIVRGPLTKWDWLIAQVPAVTNVNDAMIAMVAAISLFFIPVDARRGVYALDWETAKKLPWGILLLFGGGLSLAAAMQSTELARWLGEQVSGLSELPVIAIVTIVGVIVILLTEITSNTATANAFLPILFGVAVGIGVDPLLILPPAALAASYAFMLPVATPPNAIVFGSGHITIGQMVRAGVFLNIVGALLIPLAMYALGALALGVTF